MVSNAGNCSQQFVEDAWDSRPGQVLGPDGVELDAVHQRAPVEHVEPGRQVDVGRRGHHQVHAHAVETVDREIRLADPGRWPELRRQMKEFEHAGDEFTHQKHEMLRRTHTPHAPWTIIRSNNKFKARLNALKVILNNVPYDRLDPTVDFVPDPNIVISGARELEIMEAQMLREGKFIS